MDGSGGFRKGKSSGALENLANNVVTDISEKIGPVLSISKPSAKFASGARTILRVNGDIFAFAFGISWNIETAQTEIRTIDDYLPWEYAPSMITVSGTINSFRVPGFGPSATLIQSNVMSFLMHKYITIEVRDSATDQLLFFTNKAVITNRSETLMQGQLGTMQLTFKAIGWKDEMQPELPQDASVEDKYKNGGGAEGLKGQIEKARVQGPAGYVIGKIKG